MASSIRYELYRREILQYLSSMTIKFGPFAEIIATQVHNNTNFRITNDRENPYYRNLCGLYSFLDKPMTVLSVETGEQVPFNLDLWASYPKTASFYTMGSDAYKRLCLTYPTQVGLIKNIIYPCKDIDAVINADELTIVNQVPSFLRENERESILFACQQCLQYVRDRWFIRDYSYEDQYPLVFMAKVHLLLFSCIIKQRLVNCDTYAVHHMHVWDRLEANGLGPYESMLTDVQARWFYRNMRYLKANRGRKSNMILLADNLLQNLRVHLVGKRIMQQTTDPNDDVELIPEILSEEVVDYQVAIAESQPTTSTVAAANPLLATTRKYKSMTASSSQLVNTNAKESMDTILNRVYKEGYYPDYSVDDSTLMTASFARTVTNTVPTRLLEFQKYIVNTQYLRYLTVFLFDSMMYQFAQGNLQYRITFKDENTALPVSLTIGNALILMHYVIYKRFGITPEYLPERYPVDLAYKKTKPLLKDLPDHFWFNGFKYNMDTIVQVDEILKEIPWIDQKYESVSDFIQALALQFEVMIQHLRSAATEPDLTYQWAMWYFYKFLVAQETVNLGQTNKPYTEWLAENEGVGQLISAYDQLPESKIYYDQLANTLIAQVLPIQDSELLLRYAGAIYDNTAFYSSIKQLFTDWTSQDLTYLDTDRTDVTYLSLMSPSITTGAHVDTSTVEINDLGCDCDVNAVEMLPADLRDDYSMHPTLNDTTQTEMLPTDDSVSVVIKGDPTLTETSDTCFYDDQQMLSSTTTEKLENDAFSLTGLYQLYGAQAVMSVLNAGCDLVDISPLE